MPSERQQINFRPKDKTFGQLKDIKSHLEKRSGPLSWGDILQEIINVFHQSIPPEPEAAKPQKKSSKKISKGN